MRMRSRTPETTKDVLEVIHHEIPDTAAAAGASAIAPASYADGGLTWRRMLRGVCLAEAVAMTTLLVAGMYYGLDFFFPLAIAALLFAGAAVLLPRMTKASAVFSLVVASLTLLMFGGMFFGWTGFLYPTSWFEMSFATLSVLMPLGGIVAAVATLRHHDGADAAKVPSRLVAAVCALVPVIGIVGSLTASDATRLPGDVTLEAKNFDFEQTELSASAGDVAIYFDNNDVFAHNVKIDGHGVSEDAPGQHSIRHVFTDLAAGSYAYYCEIHPDMKGTLTVS